MPARPITQQERDEILRRHAAGETRNGIARALGRSGQTISKVVLAAGGTFERREETRVATETRAADLAALRTQLALDLTYDAMKLRQQLWEPCVVFNFGGKENDYNEREHPEPPASDKRSLMGAAGVAIDKSLRLVPPVDDTGEEAARSMLGALAEGLRRYAGPDVPEEDVGEG